MDWELFGFLTFVCVCDDVDWTEDETLSENDLPALLAIGLFTVTLLCAWLLSFVLSAVSLIDINSTFNMSFALKFKNKINIFFVKNLKIIILKYIYLLYLFKYIYLFYLIFVFLWKLSIKIWNY